MPALRDMLRAGYAGARRRSTPRCPTLRAFAREALPGVRSSLPDAGRRGSPGSTRRGVLVRPSELRACRRAAAGRPEPREPQHQLRCRSAPGCGRCPPAPTASWCRSSRAGSPASSPATRPGGAAPDDAQLRRPRRARAASATPTLPSSTSRASTRSTSWAAGSSPPLRRTRTRRRRTARTCRTEQATGWKPRAEGSVVPQVPNRSSASGASRTFFIVAGNASSRLSDRRPTTSQRNQLAPASACSTVGLNHTTLSRLSRWVVWSPPTKGPSVGGQALASLACTVRESTASRCPSTSGPSRRPRWSPRCACSGRGPRRCCRPGRSPPRARAGGSSPTAGAAGGGRRGARRTRSGSARRCGVRVARGARGERGAGAPGQPGATSAVQPLIRSVFAQQTDRRLPAFHSASWNHV